MDVDALWVVIWRGGASNSVVSGAVDPAEGIGSSGSGSTVSDGAVGASVR